MALTILLFILGLVVIIKGGDWFVDAAIWMAEATGVPKMLIGATVVSVATTLPELFVSALAVLDGAVSLGVGNAVGSVICNTGLILALSVLIRPSKVEGSFFYIKAGILAAALCLLYVMVLDRTLGVFESLILITVFIVFLSYNIHHAKKAGTARQNDNDAEEKPRTGVNVLKFAAGAAGIVIGARLLVNSGIAIATALGVSQGIIGLTIVALGTSLPELVTTITSLCKKQSELGIGNIIGANVMNLAVILPVCALMSGGLTLESAYLPLLGRVTAQSLTVDLPVAALLIGILIVPPLLLKGRMPRLQGALMIAVYIAYIVFLALNL